MRTDCLEHGEGEQGFMLVGLIVAIFLILLALSVAAPKVAQELRREREVEAVHRGNQYVRAIRLYYRKTHAFPGSIEQLEKTNNTRFLRQQYVDPMTGKADWRLIHVGEAKTTVKGFFGAPLAGLATGGLGSATPSGGIGGPTTGPGQANSSSTFGSSGFGSSSPGSSGFGSSSPGGGYGASSPGGGSGSSGLPTLGGGSSPGGTANGPATLGSDNSGTGTGMGTTGTGNTLGSASGIASSSSGGGLTGGGAPFVGVGVPKEGDSITILNEQTTYNTWEFIYDPRIEQLYAKGNLFGGGGSTGTLGSGSPTGNSGFGSTPGAPGSGTSGFGSSGFGSTPGSGGSGFGSSPGTGSPTPPTTPPQQPPQ